MSVTDLVKKLNQNKVFKFVSSIRLAVPLMLLVGVCVAYGTIIESNYNAEYAAMVIYKSFWFGALIILLWLNIFAATISRIPFKLHHTGFVITHIGLLTLLIGGYITNSDGIDGQLVIAENQSSSSVILPHLMIGYQFEGSPSPQILKFKKTISEQGPDDLKEINENTRVLFTVKKYLPFAKIEKEYIESKNSADQSVALSFILKSNFFNVNEWLHSETNPTMKMGPATLKIVKTNDLSKAFAVGTPPLSHQRKQKRVVNSAQTQESKKTADSFLKLVSITDSGDEKKIKLSSLQKNTQSYKNIKINLVKQYTRAVVSENKVVESDDPSVSNPAVELLIEQNGKKIREVLYAKFAGFSLNENGVFGYKFSYEATDATVAAPASHGIESTAAATAESLTPAQAAMEGDNTIIFSIDPKVAAKARITLIKENKVVMSEILDEGQSLQTPWMGMKIFLGSVRAQAAERIVARAINVEKSEQLPPSAILIATSTEPSEELWISEGEQKQVQLAGKAAVVFFGRQSIELPFDLKLEKFSKVDYPGTTTPLSFESLVQVGKTGVVQKISMNEPLKLEGFTIYQASYSITPEQTLSIFSVNQDPGRALKYLGSLILCLGVITITLMRSRVWRLYLQRKE